MNYSDLDILFLTIKEIPDYLQDALYYGFQELGCNVVDYPRRKSLHGSWANPHYKVPQLLFNFPENELRKRPDLLIVTALYQNYNPFSSMEEWSQFIRDTVNKYNPVKIIMIDAEDSGECSYPMLDRPYDAVFKRELFFRPYDNWFPINFSAIPEPFTYVPYSGRAYDLSFIATISNDYRIVVRDFLKAKCAELNIPAYIRVEKDPIERSELLEILSQSKTSVSVRGAGIDCYRYWEIPAKGVVMISDDHGFPINNDFGLCNTFKFRDLNELESILLKLKEKDNSGILEEMALASLYRVNQYHTPIKRAKYILTKV